MALLTPTAVEKVTIRFIVDNCIEWMTKLPPGFSSEVAQQLRNNPPVDPVTNTPFIDIEHYCCGAHGFAALVTTETPNGKHTVMFDTGPDSRSITRNLAALKVDVEDVERIVLSHWHADHSAGILPFLELRAKPAQSPIVVDLHPDRPEARGIAPPPTYDKVIGRLPPDPTFQQIRNAGGVVELHSEGHLISDGAAFVSGTIPRMKEWEKGLLGGVRWRMSDGGNGTWEEELHIMDERYLAINVLGKGMIIFSACSHAGICNVIQDAVDKFRRPIYMIVGGLHLAGPELADRVEPTVNFLSRSLRPAPTYILPMHCSGFGAKVALQHTFGEGCVPAGVGTQVVVKGCKDSEPRLDIAAR